MNLDLASIKEFSMGPNIPGSLYRDWEDRITWASFLIWHKPVSVVG